MSVIAVQFINAQLPMLVTLDGIATLVRFLQSRKAESPMLVTPSEIVTSARFMKFWKALSPMVVTLDGTVMLVASVSLIYSLDSGA